MKDKNKIKSVSIIGLGNFGKFIASMIPKDRGIDIMGHDIRIVEVDSSIIIVSFDRAALADVVVLAIPLSKYEAVLKPLVKFISRESLLVDVCSVKMEPERLIKKHLPDHPNLLLTHPLFGPQSVVNGLTGHKLAVTQASGRKAEIVLAQCAQLGLEIKQVTAEEHDKAMQIHALTLLIARALDKMGIKNHTELPTPSSQILLDLIEFSQISSPDLIETILHGNLFAAEIHYEFLKVFKDALNLKEC